MREKLNDYDNSSDFIEDRETQKQMVHPYRNYQLMIIVMIIIFIILSIININLNSELKKTISEDKELAQKISELTEESSYMEEFSKRVDVNYKEIFGLDKEKNIDIIHNYNELESLSYAIYEMGTVSYHLCYKASEDGENPLKFRDLCGGIGPTLFLIETMDGYRFAAYTNLYFTNDDQFKGFREDDEAFIFSFDTMKKYKIKQPQYAVFDKKGSFPTFGVNDIFLGSDNVLSKGNCYTLFPVSYEKDNDNVGDYLLNGGMKKFKVKELEVLWPFIYKQY